MENIKRLYGFSGPFAEQCTQYIQMNRHLGYKYKIEEVYLRQFDNSVIGKAEKGDPLTKELFEEWIQKREYESVTTHRLRYNVLGRFCKYLYTIDQRTYVGFHPISRKTKSGFTPYIFSESEIARFFETVDNMSLEGRSYKCHQVYPVLFRMLYSCGLRISEALSLKVSDVDLDNGILKIRDTKFSKSRAIPMSDSMVKVCKDYSKQLHEFSKDDNYYFASPYGGCYSECTVYTRFRAILFKAGISHGGRGRGPRMHDLRHTFAVHSLSQMAHNGIDLYTSLPLLSGYLGHKNIFSTQQYLHLTAELYPELVKNFETAFGNIFPEVPNEKA